MKSLRKAGLFGGVFLLVFAAAVCVHAAQKAASGPTREDLLSWPRTRADVFGCFLEKSFGVRDIRFNCSLKGYVNNGDPCKNPDAYDEGPAFPAGKESLIDSAVSSVSLSWEHGELQSVSLELKKKMTPARVRKLFRLPEKMDGTRENVLSVDIQDCGKNSTCLEIQGFDHMGAGDVDCGSD
jgi:hypothetical protein